MGHSDPASGFKFKFFSYRKSKASLLNTYFWWTKVPFGNQIYTNKTCVFKFQHNSQSFKIIGLKVYEISTVQTKNNIP